MLRKVERGCVSGKKVQGKALPLPFGSLFLLGQKNFLAPSKHLTIWMGLIKIIQMRKKSAKYKKCPRCGNHCLPNQAKCEECGLIFARMEFASNKAAKKKLLKFDNDFVIYTNQYPADVSYWKIFFLTIFCSGDKVCPIHRKYGV